MTKNRILTHHCRVRFNGEEYWLHDDYLLSPLDHFNEDGKLLANEFIDISYAVVEDGKIKRYQEVIGSLDELEILSESWVD